MNFFIHEKWWNFRQNASKIDKFDTKLTKITKKVSKFMKKIYIEIKILQKYEILLRIREN